MGKKCICGHVYHSENPNAGAVQKHERSKEHTSFRLPAKPIASFFVPKRATEESSDARPTASDILNESVSDEVEILEVDSPVLENIADYADDLVMDVDLAVGEPELDVEREVPKLTKVSLSFFDYSLANALEKNHRLFWQ
jgi:hypothetical protein